MLRSQISTGVNAHSFRYFLCVLAVFWCLVLYVGLVFNLMVLFESFSDIKPDLLSRLHLYW